MSVYVFALVGVALLDVFSVRCADWINCLGIDNDKLTYKHYVAHRNKTARLPVYSGHNVTADLLFPVGDSTEDFENILTIYVSNIAKYTTVAFISPVRVGYLP